MLCLLSPAKTLRLNVSGPAVNFIKSKQTVPLLQSESEKLCDLLAKAKPLDAATRNKFANHSNGETQFGGLMYAGPAFKMLDTDSFTEEELERAQNHVIVLSGLYGIVRPFDVVRPYRLEMQAKVGSLNETCNNLYEYWNTVGLVSKLVDHIKMHNVNYVINCASLEYSKAIDFAALSEASGAEILHISFGKIASVYAKQARGMFARFVVERNPKTVKDLQEFCGVDGIFKYDSKHSNIENGELAFVRGAPQASPTNKVVKAKPTKKLNSDKGMSTAEARSNSGTSSNNSKDKSISSEKQNNTQKKVTGSKRQREDTQHEMKIKKTAVRADGVRKSTRTASKRTK